MNRKIIPYNAHLKKLARKLRNNSTKAEIKLWLRLKGKQMNGFDFHRQKPILNYIVDFYCNELNLAIEVDGEIHEHPEAIEKDNIRQKEIESYGIVFLRFTNEEVLKNTDWVVEEILRWIENLNKGGGGTHL